MTSVRHLMDPAYASRKPVAEADDAGPAIDVSRVAMMCIADPFWPDDCTPDHVREAAIARLREGAGHYTTPIGDRELRVEIADKVARVNGLSVDPDRNVTVAGGGGDGLLVYATRPFLEPGVRNEILTPTPSFPTNFDIGPLTGGVTVPVPTYAEDDYDLRIDELERRVTARTKLVLLTNPNNPTATVYSRRSLERLAAFAQEHDLVVVSDQSFEDLVFDGHEMVDIAAMSGMAERTILLCSLSKGMGLCGYRVGYLVASAEITEVLHSSHHYGVVNTAAEAAGLAALREPQFVEGYRREYMARAQAVCELLDTVPNLPYTRPQSGYFVWIDVSAYGGAKSVIRYLLEEAAVLPTEGGMFGSADHLRLVFATFADRRRCLEAVERLVAALLRHPVNA